MESHNSMTILDTLKSDEFRATMAGGGSSLTPVYRTKQFTSIPDVGATVREWMRVLGPDGKTAADLIPLLLTQVVQPRVSVFSILCDDLNQTFSLDNGLAVQGLLMHWLRFVRPAKRRRTETDGDVPASLLALKREQQPLAVWWEARLVRLSTWPPSLREELVIMARAVIQAVTSAECPSDSAEACQHSILTGLSDICVSCSHKVLAALTTDYKCVHLLRVDLVV